MSGWLQGYARPDHREHRYPAHRVRQGPDTFPNHISRTWKEGTALAAFRLPIRRKLGTCSSKLQQQTRDLPVPAAPVRVCHARHFASRDS